MISVVIPCYRVKNQIFSVLDAIGDEVTSIYVVDDNCPESTGLHVEQNCKDNRVKVLYNSQNLGVGGATKVGYEQSIQDKADVIVKIDGDGQMDPALIPLFVIPIIEGEADYTKGNRFYRPELLKSMPPVRVFGNTILSFVNKLTSGYWHLMDPTNGFTAVHRSVIELLPLNKIDNRYFFESDMLFRLNTFRAVVQEIPMEAVYGDETSNLNISKIIFEFPRKYLLRFIKRLYYNYFLRDFNVCSLEMLAGSVLNIFGFIFGIVHWYLSIKNGVPATTGTVMLAALPIILGFNLLLSAAHFDILNIPSRPLHLSLKRNTLEKKA